MRWTRPLTTGLGIALVSILFISAKVAAPRQDKPIKVIVIDAGHGGHDSGAKGKFSTEKDISLSVALKLGKIIEDKMPDVKVVYTRKVDRFDDPREKARIANDAMGDLFISIHCNAAYGRKISHYTKRKGSKKKYPVYVNVPSAAKGTETYVWATSKNSAKTDALRSNSVIVLDANSEESKQMMDANDPASMIMRNTLRNAFFDNSLRLSNLVEDEFTQVGRISRGARQRDEKGIWVLQATAMPSVLIELGFISNEEEEEYLNSAAGQNETANAIFRATKRYKEHLERYGENTPVESVTPPQPAAVEKPVQNTPVSVKNEQPLPPPPAAEAYKVQLCITDKVYTENSTVFKKLGPKSNIEREQVLIDRKKKYKYLLGTFRTEAEAHAAMYKAQKQGFPDAFVVPYKNGLRLNSLM
ncbi:N-acetylmuramoyl-L-alanine amidase [uncultured Chitinophaga sp.]|uniref:N-acetylmuramoyl-L-alanine amidase family protein n=1 Tax=uncultured Chitinophaga sp. TaxID=339340 RepID=UPI0025EAB48C|nr:N-acetylmuramoyl-L-alanine amidase [uncultured Chitinophaga sp.]